MNATIVAAEKVKRLVYGYREFKPDDCPEDLKCVPVTNFIAMVDMMTRDGRTTEVGRRILSAFPGYFWVEGTTAILSDNVE